MPGFLLYLPAAVATGPICGTTAYGALCGAFGEGGRDRFPSRLRNKLGAIRAGAPEDSFRINVGERSGDGVRLGRSLVYEPDESVTIGASFDGEVREHRRDFLGKLQLEFRF